MAHDPVPNCDALPNYWDYLKLDRLLDLQSGLGTDEADLMSDELHFIIVHQVFELWFKLMLRELRLARSHLAVPDVPEAHIPHVVHHLRRVNAIAELTVDQFKVVETLTPQDFLAFRDKLMPASGFQSFQMRELEILLGLEDAERLRYQENDPIQHILGDRSDTPAAALAKRRVEEARAESSLRTALHAWLYRTPIQGSRPDDPGDEDVVREFLDHYLEALEHSQRVATTRLAQTGIAPPDRVWARAEKTRVMARRFLAADDVAHTERARTMRARAGLLFIESYRDLPLLAWPRLLIDTVVELEEQLVLFRTRHARMVERVIGRRTGTGGSSGVDYLDGTARYRIFTDLWNVRTILLPRDAVPPLDNAEMYEFAVGLDATS